MVAQAVNPDYERCIGIRRPSLDGMVAVVRGDDPFVDNSVKGFRILPVQQHLEAMCE